ncbi:MAG: phosphate signaling complex protein PhoU [bacterium]|nr:phosphate signaling complex protein PhoU [bacterium]
MNRTFEEDLDKLRTRLIRMGSLVEEQVEFALRALREGNLELARIVTERDDKIDKLDLKIDKQCQRIFALNQPVASDLRLLLAAVKINNELERIGDMAHDIATLVMRAPGAVELATRIDVARLSSATYRMVKSSLDAFINNDPELATHILPSDATVDQLYSHLQSELVAVMNAEPSTVTDGASLIIALHTMERMADHATNIAENVIFLVHAKLVRHRAVNEDGIDLSDIHNSSILDNDPD